MSTREFFTIVAVTLTTTLALWVAAIFVAAHYLNKTW